MVHVKDPQITKVRQDFKAAMNFNLPEGLGKIREVLVDAHTNPHRQTQKDKKSGLFSGIKNKTEIEGYLVEAEEERTRAIIWTNEAAIPLEFKVIDVDPKTKTFSIQGLTAEGFEDFYQSAQSREVALGKDHFYFNLTLKRAKVFFLTKIEHGKNGELRFSFPQQVFEVQRRRHHRLNFSEDLKNFPSLFVFVPEKKEGLKVIDLGGGGMALEVPKDQVALFPVDSMIKGLKFVLCGREVSATVRVRTLSSIRKTGFQKVGLEFTDVKPRDLQFLEFFIFEKSREYFSRWIKV
jgi:c-di-GMP-binding flagellar brake protein YcgR